MRPIDKFNLLDRIGRELQSRMTFSDIDVYLSTHGIDCKDKTPSANSKWVYAKEILADADDKTILSIADDLEIEHDFSIKPMAKVAFWRTGYFRLFISHLASFKVQASRLQASLKEYGVSSFVAHEDIEPSKEWQAEIEAALHTMDALTALLVPGFKESNWCDQEVGVAVGRDVLIIPVRKNLDPYGFIGKYQAIQAKGKTIREVAEAIFTTLVHSPKTRQKMLRALAVSISQLTDVDDASSKLEILRSVENIPEEVLIQLREQVKENNVLMVNDAFLATLNMVLASYGVEDMSEGGRQSEDEFGDIPF